MRAPYTSTQADEAKAQFAHVDGDHLSLLNVYHAYKQVDPGPCILSLITQSLHILSHTSTLLLDIFIQMPDCTSYMCVCVCVAGDDSRYRNCSPLHCRTILLQLIHMRLHTPHYCTLLLFTLLNCTQFNYFGCLCNLKD
jgi:hypothetical protein